MPFNHGPITEEEEAAAWAAVLEDYELMRKRLAELEAERAAHRWRPVTEPPTVVGDYAVMASGWPDSVAAHYDLALKGSSEEWEWVWVGFDGENIPVTHWQPLPPAPGEEPRP